MTDSVKTVKISNDAQIASATSSIPPSLATSAAGTAAASTSDDAIKYSVPRTQAKSAATDDPSATLNSLLNGLRSVSDPAAVHGGLDAARVFSLLEDDDE